MLGINGFEGLFSWPLGYVIMRVQMEEVWGHDEDQVALVIPHSTACGSWVPVTLATPTINWIINMIKESKVDELSASLNGSRIYHLLACHQAELSIRRWSCCCNLNCGSDQFEWGCQNDIQGRDRCFSSKIIHGWTKTTLLGNNMHVMIQTLREWWTLLAWWLKCCEYLHWSDYWEQASCNHGEKSDCHSNHYQQGH